MPSCPRLWPPVHALTHDDQNVGAVSTSEVIAIVAAAFAALSTLFAAWAAYTAQAVRRWQRERDAERRRTGARADVMPVDLHAGRRRTRARAGLMPLRTHARRPRVR